MRIYEIMIKNITLWGINISSYIASRSTYLDDASLEGPEHVLKGTMRSTLIRNKNAWLRWVSRLVVLKGWSWIAEHQVILQTNDLFLWLSKLYRYIGCFPSIESGETKLHTYTLTNALGNNNKRCSLSYKVISWVKLCIKSKNVFAHVNYKTGEVCYYENIPCSCGVITDDRGFIVVLLPTEQIDTSRVKGVFTQVNESRVSKKAKHLNKISPKRLGLILFRSYNTKDNITKKSEPGQVLEEKSKDFESVIKHWRNCLQQPSKIFSDLKGFLKRDSIWYAAFIKVMKNRGSKTAGPDNLAANTLTREKILEIKKQVLDGNWNWVGVKRVNIPKKQGTRPLVIPSINDRLVQEVLKIIIEPIFELQFVENSFGFRPNRSCHTALQYINTRLKDSTWVIEGDIKGYFDNIDHKILMSIIKKRISDPLILKIIRNGLKCKVFEGKYSFHNEIGIPQGGILSPLLSNIYLHEFDIFMKELSTKYQRSVLPSKRRINPEYSKLKNKKLTFLAQKRRISRCDPFEKNYQSVKYVRYADDFIISINGSLKLAHEIKKQITIFLLEKLKLIQHQTKTKITHINKGIHFLGHIWSRSSYMIKQMYAGKLRNRRMQSYSFKISTKQVVKVLQDKRFCDGGGNPLPYMKNLRLPQSETNLMANAVIRGLCNWWIFASNRRKITSYVAYIIRYSIAKMYAAKFRLGTVAKIFKVGRNDLSVAIGNTKKSAVGVIDIKEKKKIQGILYDKYHKIPKKENAILSPDWKPEYLIALQKGDSAEIIKYLTEVKGSTNPLKTLGWRIRNTLSRQGSSCAICGSFEDVQMHHTKAIKNIKTKDKLKKYVQAIEIPQVALCRKHHLEMHKGNWKNNPSSMK